MKKIGAGIRDYANAILSDPDKLTRLVAENGELTSFKIPFSKTIHIIAKPSFIKHIFFENPENYIRDRNSFGGLTDILGKYGLSEPHIWQKDKKIIIQQLTKEKMQAYADVMAKSVAKQLDEWEIFVDKNTPFYIDREISTVALYILLDSFFSGIRIDVAKINDLIRQIFYLSSPLVYPYVKLFGKIPMPLYFKYKKVKKQIETIGWEVVEKSFAVPTEDNFIKHLAKGLGCTNLNIEQLDDEMKEHLIGRGFGFILAGHDTTSGSLGKAYVLLSLYPMVAEKIREEVNTVLGSRVPTYDDLQKLTYTRAVFKEILRLQPTNSCVARSCLKDETFEGLTIKKGDLLLFPLAATQRLAKYWPNPEGFDPNRFLEPLNDDQKLLYMPFAHGPESCIGMQYAMTEVTLILAMVAQRYRLELTSGTTLTRERGMLNRINANTTMRVCKV